MEKECTAPVWSFVYEDIDGNITTKTFKSETETWIEALQQFIVFCKGCGFSIIPDAVAIRDDFVVPEEAWSGETYTPDSKTNSHSPWNF